VRVSSGKRTLGSRWKFCTERWVHWEYTCLSENFFFFFWPSALIKGFHLNCGTCSYFACTVGMKGWHKNRCTLWNVGAVMHHLWTRISLTPVQYAQWIRKINYVWAVPGTWGYGCAHSFLRVIELQHSYYCTRILRQQVINRLYVEGDWRNLYI